MADQDPRPPDQAADVETAGSATAAAVAVALGRRSHSSGVDIEAEAFLKDQRRLSEKQGRMLDLQMECLAEDRALQHRHLALKYFGDRLRIGLQLIGIALGLLVLGGLGALVWQAHEEHGLVIEAFSVPLDLAQQGLTGQVVAARVLDKLQAMESAATPSPEGSENLKDSWGSDVKIEIPNVGLTLDEFERLLRSKFGHVSRVSGEVFHTADGLAISARLGAQPSQTFTGKATDIDALTQKAAEAIYQASQPYRFFAYLYQNGRKAESHALLEHLVATDTSAGRWRSLVLLGQWDYIDDADPAAANRHLMAAYSISGGDPEVVGMLENLETTIGHDEAALRYLKESASKTPHFLNSWSGETELINTIAAGDKAFRLGDFVTAARVQGSFLRRPDPFENTGVQLAYGASAFAKDHDPAAARALIATFERNDDTAFLLLDDEAAIYALPNFDIAAATDDWASALALIRASNAWIEAHKPDTKSLGIMQATWTNPLEALALAKTGDIAGAEALIAETPADCYLCVSIRGQIAAMKGDVAASERWFAEAVRQAPSLPKADAEWGAARLARGDVDGAIVEFKLAHQKGPEFADPLEGWGEALMRKGDYAGAVAKFREANEDAPRWGRNHLMWSAAAEKLGRAADAKAQHQAAAAADRATVGLPAFLQQAINEATNSVRHYEDDHPDDPFKTPGLSPLLEGHAEDAAHESDGKHAAEHGG
jgi:tetratricopeptide (TPR) repeat protein